MTKRMFLGIIAVLCLCTILRADIRLPAVIGDNMVLQQQTSAVIWGWAEPEEEITAAAGWGLDEVKTVSNKDGKWELKLQTPKAGGPYAVTLKGKNTITLNNVMIGEVWLCSGQSNMQFTLGKGQRWMTGDINAESEIPVANYPSIRLFTVTPKYNDAVQADCNGAWVECTPETAVKFSAVGYYFGRELHKKLGVPVGLICSAYGGTAAEAWTGREAFAADSELAQILAKYDKDKTEYPSLRQQYDKELSEWEAQKAKAAEEGRQFTQTAPTKPSRVPNQNSPAVLWNAMIKPIVPYAIKGVIWYQGESNVQRPRQYVRLFQIMVNCWRQEWKQGEFPFYFVQIAPYKDMTPEIREAQRMAFQKMSSTGMVVTTDVGDCGDIHPRNKRPVGQRLANWALAKTYGIKDIVVSGPMFKEMKLEGDKIRLSFDYAEGLKAKGDELGGFTIAGADRKFVPAKAKIDGSTIVVWNDEVKSPAAVRFGWENCPQATLFNGAGLPASPFRTDEWPLETDNAPVK